MKYSFKWVLICALALSSCQLTLTKEPQRRPSSILSSDVGLNRDQISEIASSGPLQLQAGEMLIDNDSAFETKIKAIQSAKRDETLRIAYYIYADDYSSSLFTSELLKAAKRGVKVKLLVDYLTNYTRLDLFNYMQSEGKANLEVRFYGKPTDFILRDFYFLTLPCPNTPAKDVNSCSNFKWNNISSIQKQNKTNFWSSLLLSGLYGKYPEAIKSSILLGQQLDLEALKQGTDVSKEEQKQLQDFLKLVARAKFQGDISAKIKVAMALRLYGDDLVPLMNEIYGRLPLSQMGESSTKDWQHISDFIHHKILLVENRELILGGRNLEDSYHMKPNPLTKKYIFMDTDFHVRMSQGGESIARSFDEIWNFKAFVDSVSEINKYAPNDLVMNMDLLQEQIPSCIQEAGGLDQSKIAPCLTERVYRHPSFKSSEQRKREVEKAIQDKSQVYLSQYAKAKQKREDLTGQGKFSNPLTAKDLKSALAVYVENVPFNKKKSANERKRVFGSINDEELQSGKGIHKILVKSLQQACLESAQTQKETRVVLHSAYWLPSSNLIRTFAHMMDGTLDCRHVKVQMITNSFETTDLNIINVFARYQMKGFFDIYQTRKGLWGSDSEKSAQFEFYEYDAEKIKAKAAQQKNAASRSLHTKVSLIGRDLIVGSANMDVRSYYMDSNNGLFIRGADEMNQTYLKYIDQLIATQTVRRVDGVYMSSAMSLDSLKKQDELIAESLKQKFKFLQKANPETARKAIDLFIDLNVKIYNETKIIMSKDYIMENIDRVPWGPDERVQEQRKIEAQYNELLMLL